MCQKCIDECHDENRCIRCGEPIEDKSFWKSDTSDEEWYEKAYGENWRSIVYGERNLREDELDNLNVDAFLEKREMFKDEDTLQLFDENGNEIILEQEEEEPNIELIEDEQYDEDDSGNAYEEFEYYDNDENYENIEPNGFDDM